MMLNANVLVVATLLAFLATADAQGIRGVVRKERRHRIEKSPLAIGVHGRGLGEDVDSAASDLMDDKKGKGFMLEVVELSPDDFEDDKGGKDEDGEHEDDKDAEDSGLAINEPEKAEIEKGYNDTDVDENGKDEDGKDDGAGFVSNDMEDYKDDKDKNNVVELDVDDFEGDKDDKDNGNEDENGEDNKDVDLDENEDKEEDNKDEDDKDVDLDGNEDNKDEDNKDADFDEIEDEQEGNKDDKDEDNKEVDLDGNEDDMDDKDEDNTDVDLDENEEVEKENSTAVFALPDIVDIAMETSSLSALYRLVAAAGLEATLRAPGPFTLFAPINAAFPEGTIFSRLKADHTPPSVLTYHVVTGLIRSANLTNGQIATTLHGDNITALLYPTTGTIMIDHAKIIYADIEASNGIVHLIDRVLEPSSICGALQVSDFECSTMDAEVGVMVCRDGNTTCSLVSELLKGDTCGCCLEDTSPDCGNGDLGGETWENMELAPLPQSTPSANGICSAQQVSELACDVVEDVSGVVVCHGGNTTCTLTVQTKEGETCGCCPGDVSPACDGVIASENFLGDEIDFFGGDEEDIDFEIERCFGC